ncbi:MAG TPA: tetratricopeptide repeat protein [Croceibacterium sp.]
MSFTRWQASRMVVATLALAGGILTAAMPAAAQSDDARLRKMEAEINALQRKVFPGPDGKYFEPEVVTPGVHVEQAPQQAVGTPSTSALTDVLARLDSIETQLRQLTAHSEVTDNALAKLEMRVDALESRNAAPALAASDAAAAEQPIGAIPIPGEARLAGSKAAKATEGRSAGATSAGRLARVRAVVKPQTDDPADDEYSYGFHLWEAGLYPEAEQQLKLYVDKYANHREISYGRNLLGRAYLDDGQPKVAAGYFLENYQKDPSGARAPDSLLYLAESMIALKDDTRACRALSEFSDKYPALAVGRLQDQYGKDRKQAGCK